MSDLPLDREVFIKWCGYLPITSKDEGIVPFKLHRQQVYVVDQIIAGLREGIHFFIIDKCRQAKVSSVCFAFDVYWSLGHDGTQGLIVADSDERRTKFRGIVSNFVRGLPAEAEWRQPVLTDNEHRIEFGNNSELMYANANQRVKGTLGRGVGISLLHGSEVAYWSDPKGLKSMMAALSKKNPARLFILESTANGNNMFRKLWYDAGRNISQKQIFVGWWLVEGYEYPEDSNEYRTYWDGRLSDTEQGWAASVKRRWGWDITPQQWAWWRFTLAEEYGDDNEMMLQEYPPTPEESFQFTGGSYIKSGALNRHLAHAEDNYAKAQRYYFEFGTRSITDTQIHKAEEKHFYDLEIYNEPVSGSGVAYVIGCDPSHGVDETSDNAVAQVFRCYTDRIQQVAEFAARGLAPYELAWVLLLLSKSYTGEFPTVINIELAGGGAEVMQEIKRVEDDMGIGYPDKLSQMFTGTFSHYYFRRPDSVGGTYTAIHYKATSQYREDMLSALKSHIERGIAMLYSPALITELSELVRAPTGSLEPATKTSQTDRVFAAALAAIAFNQNVIPQFLAGSNYSYDYFNSERSVVEGRPVSPEEYITDRFYREVYSLRKSY